MPVNPHEPNSYTASPPNRAEHPARKIGDHESPMADIAKRTNSAGGSYLQLPASKQAEGIGKSWRNTPAHRYAHEAVLWSQAGHRDSGTFVSPSRDPKTGESGVNLHRVNGAPTFYKDTDVHEVHFVEKPGMPDSATREEMHRKEQSQRNQTVE